MASVSSKKTQALIKEFKAQYFELRQDNSKAKATYKSSYQGAFNKLPQASNLSLADMKAVIAATEPNSRLRKQYVLALAALARFAGLPDISLMKLKGDYSPFDLPPRTLPSDELIADTFASLADKPDWQWLLGMLATYGLKPYEAFHVKLELFPLVEVPASCPHPRWINPIYPEWAEQWNLQNHQPPKCTGSLESLGRCVGNAFLRYRLPFKATDLRHRWSERALEFGCDPLYISSQLGISLWAYSRTYHASITKKASDDAYQRLLNNPNRPRPPM